jgi:putative long chain acyl-CoA synthase
MFAYQAAAYRRSEGIRSIITFGSPVDIRATVPPIFDDELLDRAVRAIRNTMELPLQHLEQLPGFITSKAFKLLSIRKELTQFLEFFRLLDDREALRRRESRRRFLGGEGFVAWPGPALRVASSSMVGRSASPILRFRYCIIWEPVTSWQSPLLCAASTPQHPGLSVMSCS